MDRRVALNPETPMPKGDVAEIFRDQCTFQPQFADQKLQSKVQSMTICIYRRLDKPTDCFSDEHICPDALGGDFLPPLWRTNDVCQNCNNMSGAYVDGAFIKSWMGDAERARRARLSISRLIEQALFPLIAHQLNTAPNPALTELAAKRTDPSTLPPC
jgi:hypothetical protein